VLFEGVDDEEDEDSGYGTGNDLDDLSNMSEDHHHKKVDQGLRLQEGGEYAEARTKSHTKGHIVSHVTERHTRPRPRSASMSSNSELAGFGDGGGDDDGGNSGNGGGGAIAGAVARSLTDSMARVSSTRSRRTSPNPGTSTDLCGTSVIAADERDSNTPVPIAASVVVGGSTTPFLAEAANSGSAGAAHGVAAGPRGGGKGGNAAGGTGRDKMRRSAVGASGAQSTIVPLVDRLLGVR
jgi:hypothetical protein